MIQLTNDKIEARIDPFGAELKSLKKEGREYLWQGDPGAWTGQSPQLFPIIGMTIDGGWDYRGKTVNMGNHGFARKSLFTVEHQGDGSCLLTLRDSDESLSEYPFPFVLKIGYTLTDQGLEVSYGVKNPASQEMFFSLGAHPGFNCPLDEDLGFNDYYIEFEKNETISRRWKDNFLTGESEQILSESRRIDLNHSLFDRGAIILSGLESDSVVLKSDKSGAAVRMDFSGFPDFGIWTITGKKAPYICLEPWFGVDSTEGDSPDFETKEGLVRLEGQGEFKASYALTLS